MLAMASGAVPELDPLATVRAAADAGFEAVGLWIEPEAWSPALVRDVRAAVRDRGLALLDVEVVWLRPGDLPDTALRVVDLAVELGAPNLLVVSSDPIVAASAEKLARMCDHAGGAPLRIALEFGPFAEIATLAQACAVVAATGRARAALLLDPYHLYRTGGSAAHIRGLPRDWLSYAQFCDARFDPADGAIVDRDLPGEGGLPLDDFLDALPAELPLSVELRSPTLYKAIPDPFERARHVGEVTRAYLARRARRPTA